MTQGEGKAIEKSTSLLFSLGGGDEIQNGRNSCFQA